MGTDYDGFNAVYTPRGRLEREMYALRILTDQGVTGEWFGGDATDYATLPIFSGYLIGKDALERERIYTDVRKALRQVVRIGLAPVDVALRDLAGRYHNAPIYQLLGGYKKSVPCYASTYHGDENDGLSSPEAYADFAEQCKEMGYPAFKVHVWRQARYNERSTPFTPSANALAERWISCWTLPARSLRSARR